MKSSISTLLRLSFLFFIFSTQPAASQTGCCPSPDSLIVTSVTDSVFCVKWRISDSVHCDTLKKATLQYRPVGTTTWTSVTIIYTAGQRYGVKCDTVIPCTKYQ